MLHELSLPLYWGVQLELAIYENYFLVNFSVLTNFDLQKLHN